MFMELFENINSIHQLDLYLLQIYEARYRFKPHYAHMVFRNTCSTSRKTKIFYSIIQYILLRFWFIYSKYIINTVLKDHVSRIYTFREISLWTAHQNRGRFAVICYRQTNHFPLYFYCSKSVESIHLRSQISNPEYLKSAIIKNHKVSMASLRDISLCTLG